MKMFNMLDDHHQVKTKEKRTEGEEDGVERREPQMSLECRALGCQIAWSEREVVFVSLQNCKLTSSSERNYNIELIWGIQQH